MSKRPQIFVSYARKDEDRVKALYQKLCEAGFKPWMDTEDILAGQIWKDCILKEIRRSDFFMLCLSRNSIDRRGTLQEEINEALSLWKQKLPEDIFLIPARLEDCELTDDRLRPFQWVDLFKPDGFSRLEKALRVGTERLGLGNSGKGTVSGPENASLGTASPTQKPQAAADAHPAAVAVPQLLRGPGGLVVATPENLAWLLAQSQQRVWWEKAAMELCLVPAGEFLMGSPDSDKDADADEKPQHKVYLDAFYIGRYPVTRAQYALFKKDTHDRVSGKEHPVAQVSWDDAHAYCAWAGLRLPAEAEWEKAAGWDFQTGRKRLYPWGDEWDLRKCNTSEGDKGGTTAVGAYSPAGDSSCGCADMAGNVWEWTADWYYESYYGRSPDSNPTGPKSGDFRVLRGGAWYFTLRYARVSYRGGSHPGFYVSVGFRVVVAPI